MQILSRIDELICLHYRWQCEDYRIVCGCNVCVRNYIQIAFNACTLILEGIILFNVCYSTVMYIWWSYKDNVVLLCVKLTF